MIAQRYTIEIEIEMIPLHSSAMIVAATALALGESVADKHFYHIDRTDLSSRSDVHRLFTTRIVQVRC